jgi:hypothetical protein
MDEISCGGKRQAKADAAVKIPVTFFAPAEREPVAVVHRQARSFQREPLVDTLLNATLDYVFLLNERRQIVLASENVLKLVPGKTMAQIVGLRPGEALGCIHADECESGCGTSLLCRKCAAVRVILSGLDGRCDMQVCHITRRVKGRKGRLDLRVLSTPVVHDQQRFTLLAAEAVDRRRK